MFWFLQKRQHPLHTKQEKKIIFPSLTFFSQVARLARGGDAAPSFHPKAPLILECNRFKAGLAVTGGSRKRNKVMYCVLDQLR